MPAASASDQRGQLDAGDHGSLFAQQLPTHDLHPSRHNPRCEDHGRNSWLHPQMRTAARCLYFRRPSGHPLQCCVTWSCASCQRAARVCCRADLAQLKNRAGSPQRAAASICASTRFAAFERRRGRSGVLPRGSSRRPVPTQAPAKCKRQQRGDGQKPRLQIKGNQRTRECVRRRHDRAAIRRRSGSPARRTRAADTCGAVSVLSAKDGEIRHAERGAARRLIAPRNGVKVTESQRRNGLLAGL